MAVKEAQKSNYTQRVGAVIIKKKTVLSKGHNYAHKSAKKLHPRFQQWKDSVHAEVDCILKARCNLEGASIYVIRLNKNNKFRNSRPCKYCLRYLKYVGIKKVFYSIDKYPYIITETI
ncbi:MAG: hypothetical protein GWP10_13575 [Nitrospiraceae bacterium]|nr:hypothetical protein [Nitrospiraceae bacterium]